MMNTGWSAERRKAQSERILATKPWLKSTGPKSKAGKAKISRNAVKHGDDRAAMKAVKKSTQHHREFMRLVTPFLLDPHLAAAFTTAETDYRKSLTKRKACRPAKEKLQNKVKDTLPSCPPAGEGNECGHFVA